MMIRIKNFKRYDLFIVFFFIICFTIIFSYYAILKHNSFFSRTWDFGIFDQIFWYMSHHGTQINTLETIQSTFKLEYINHLPSTVAIPTPQQAVPVNHLGVHFSPILYLFAPIYALFPNPKTLFVLQAFALGLGALPLYLIAKKKTGSIFFAEVLSICYLFHPALYNISLFDFHEIAFAPVFILFTLYFLEISKFRWFWIFFFLSLFIKEEIALSFLFLGFYIILAKKEIKLGLLVSFFSLIYFISIIKFVMPFFGQPYDFTNRYLEFSSSNNKGYTGIIIYILTNPLEVLKFTFLDSRKLLYLIQLFYPVLFLPLFSRVAIILLIPGLLINLLSTYNGQFSTYFHYNGVIIAVLFYITILGYMQFPKKLQKVKPILPWLILVLTFISTSSTISRLIIHHNFPIPSIFKENIVLENMLKEIPPNASVASTINILPHITERDEVWLFPAINNAEYVLFTTSENDDYWPAGYIKTFGILMDILMNKKYGVLDYKKGYVLLKKGFNTSKNYKVLFEVAKRYENVKEIRNSALYGPTYLHYAD